LPFAIVQRDNDTMAHARLLDTDARLARFLASLFIPLRYRAAALIEQAVGSGLVFRAARGRSCQNLVDTLQNPQQYRFNKTKPEDEKT
jgi:hypothetical protein